MNNIKITTLVENTVTAGLAPLIAEHGLSFFIDTGEKKSCLMPVKGLLFWVMPVPWGSI